MKLTAALLGALLLASSLPAAPPEQPLREQFGDEITVSLVPVTVRVVDGRGRPVLGLGPEDFRVRVRKREVPVVSVDWISSGEPLPVDPEEPEATEDGEEPSTPAPGTSPGKLVVFFVQADLNPTRITGQMRLRPHTRELLSTLHPSDRMAVVAFDSQLRLRQDFTLDRGTIHRSIDRAMLFGGEEPWGRAGGALSLASHFDFQEARKAASPERALTLLGEALERLPGEKVVVYLGWGIGRFSSFGVHMTPDYKPAVRALRQARASVFVLDVTSADYHSLEVGLQNVAEATGGSYERTFRLPALATDRLAGSLAGYYVVTIDPGTLPEKKDALRVELRDRKKGFVYARPVTASSLPSPSR